MDEAMKVAATEFFEDNDFPPHTFDTAIRCTIAQFFGDEERNVYLYQHHSVNRQFRRMAWAERRTLPLHFAMPEEAAASADAYAALTDKLQSDMSAHWGKVDTPVRRYAHCYQVSQNVTNSTMLYEEAVTPYDFYEWFVQPKPGWYGMSAVSTTFLRLLAGVVGTGQPFTICLNGKQVDGMSFVWGFIDYIRGAKTIHWMRHTSTYISYDPFQYIPNPDLRKEARQWNLRQGGPSAKLSV